jgi:UDP-glucuronate decarboxylase
MHQIMINFTNQVVQNDLQFLHQASVSWEHLKNKTFLVTGATGMLASYFTFILMYLNQQEHYGIKLFLLARNRRKLEHVFGKESAHMIFLIQDVCEKIRISSPIDYILHAAGAASPSFILNDPAGIARANTLGTLNVLELAMEAKTQKVIFTSTREIYGRIDHSDIISENDMGIIDPLDSRSCYPESKRMAETLLKSYSIQHRINFNTLRIAHVYGPGMQLENDGRIMADLLNHAMNKQDIQLKSDGTVERAFCYITDAVEAIYRVIIDGKENEAYNISNEKEPITILELARLIQTISASNKNVSVKTKEAPGAGYCSYKRVNLDTSKTEALGWKQKVSLSEGIHRTLNSFPNLNHYEGN